MEKTQNWPADAQPDWTVLLPRQVFREVIRVLRGSMPIPAEDGPAEDGPEEDGPDEWGRRDRAAMAAVASLRPETAAEGQLAAQFVLAQAWAADCLRQAGERRRETGIAMKCRAQALSFMREAKSAWRLLGKAQAERKALEKDAEAANRAEWVEHAVLRMMAEGLAAEEAGGVVGEAVPIAQDAPVAPHPGPPHEGEGEERVAIGGGDFAVENVSEFGFCLIGTTNSLGTRRETETGVPSSRAPAFASG